MTSWPRVRLRRVCEINPATPEFVTLSPDREVTFLPLEAVWGDSLDTSRVRAKAELESGYTRFREGDILVPKITPTFEASRSAIARGMVSNVGCGTTELHVLRPRSNLDPRFLFYITHSRRFLQEGTGAMYGVAGQKRVPQSMIADHEVDLPSLEEQRRVAGFLDRETARIDGLIAARQRMLALTEERFESGLELAIGAGRYRRERLSRAADGVTVGVVVNPSTYVMEGGSVPYFRGVDVQPFRLNLAHAQRTSTESSALLRKSMLRAGDIVCIRVGEPGVAAVVPEEAEGANCASLLIIRRSERVNSEYLCYVFNSRFGRTQFRALAQGAAQLQVNATDAVDFEVPMPPRNIQDEIVARLNQARRKLDQLKAAIGSQVTRLRERRYALITAAVTGQLDIAEAA